MSSLFRPMLLSVLLFSSSLMVTKSSLLNFSFPVFIVGITIEFVIWGCCKIRKVYYVECCGIAIFLLFKLNLSSP